MKFEHRVRVYRQMSWVDDDGKLIRNDMATEFEEDAERRGAQGWEIAGIAGSPDAIVVAYKRQVPDTKKKAADVKP